MSARVYSYGTVPPRVAPVSGESTAEGQLRLANRLWNVLCAIERVRIERYRATMRDEQQERIDSLREKIQALRDEIKARRKSARKRSVDTADVESALTEARAEMGSLIEAQKATKQARHDERRAELTALSERTKHRIKRARQAAASMGLFWGTYNDIIGRADTGRKAGELHFRRWRQGGDGTLTAQIMGGALPGRCTDGGHGFFQVGPPVMKRKWRYARMRIGSDAERQPVWLEIPIVLHRPIPETSMIKSVSMTRRGGKWSLNVTVLEPNAMQSISEAAVAVDIGWRLLPDGVRVAYWTDATGQHGQVLIAASDIGQLAKVRDLRSKGDLMRDEFQPALTEWLAGQTLNEDWQRESAAIAQWRSPDRLARLIRWWADHHMDGDEEVFSAAFAWRKQYLHLANWWRNLEDQIRLRIREQYRVFAAGVARRYGVVCIEQFDLREVAELPEVEEKTGNPASSGYRQMVSPSVFRGALRNACLREGLRIIEVPSADTTRVCHVCGRVCKWDQAGSLRHTCECGASWDQDYNAAINLLVRGLASGEAVSTENQQVRERKWDRVRNRSRVKAENVDPPAVAL